MLGGYGYSRDFPVEQLWRDNRLNMIHEGTHGIQALDLLGRKVGADDGAGMKLLFQRIGSTADAAAGFPDLAAHAAALRSALQMLGAATAAALDTDSPALRVANATPYLQAFGHVIVAWLWLDLACASARVAKDRAAPHPAGFRQTCHYFFGYELPRAAAWLQAVAQRDTTCLEMQDEWF